MKQQEYKPQPDVVCNDCGHKYGRNPKRTAYATFYDGVCEVCGKKGQVTEPRDFGYIDWNKVSV